VAFPDRFETPRLTAERLTAAHFDALRIMDTDEVKVGYGLALIESRLNL